MGDEDEENRFEWRVGLQNPADHFLTAEPYGHTVNAAGVSLKNRQIWLLHLNRDDSVYIRSQSGNYLSVDKFGNISCKGQFPTETEKFRVEYLTDGSGRWGFKHIKNTYYLGGDGDNIQCLAKSASDEELSAWYVPIAMHPQIALRNVTRRRHVILREDQFQCTEITPWGPNALITVEFKCGKYSFQSADSRYLNRDGTLTDIHDVDTKFTMEITLDKESNLFGLAFRDCEGKYLTPSGPKGILRTRKKTISKDELFTFEICQPQVSVSASNEKFLSIRQGIEVLASQLDKTDKEIYQLEHDPDTNKWAFLTVDEKYWRCNENGGILADCPTMRESCLFQLVWQEDGKCAIRASNGKFVFQKKTGNLVAGSFDVKENEQFIIRIVNRPLIVLKGENGYVGLKTNGAIRTGYLSNKAGYDVMSLEYGTGTVYHIKGDNDKYWIVEKDGCIHNKSNEPQPFILEMHGNSCITIRGTNNLLLTTEKSGGLLCKSDAPGSSCLWRI